MSIGALNTIFNDSVNSGVMRILYDFSETGVSPVSPFKQFPSVDNAQTGYPAILKAYQSGITSATSENLAYNGGSGVKLFGGVLPQDYEQYLMISGGSTIFTGQEFTFLIEGKKLCRTDFSGLAGDGAIHDKEIVFSNMVGSPPNVSGWEIGLNSANRLYFKTWDQEQPKTLTFNNVPYGKNLWFVTHEDKNITVAWFDPAERTVLKNTLNLFDDLTNGGEWYLGSGAFSNFSSLDTGSANSRTSSVELDTFAFFDKKFFDSYLSVIGTALKSSGIFTTGVETGIEYDLSGINEVCVDVSGVLYSSWIVDHVNYITGTTTGTEPAYTNLTGLVPDGSDYYVYESGNNGYITETNNSGGSITGITGFAYGYPITTGVTEVPVYVYQEVSGVIDEECFLQFVLTGASGLSTGVEMTSTGYSATDLFPDSISYLGPRYSGDFVEIITGNTSYSGTSQILNIIPVVGESSFGLTKTLFLNDPSFVVQSGSIFFLNGLAQRLGTGELVTGLESGLQSISVSLQREYASFSDSPREFVVEYPFTGNDQILNLWGVIDVGQQTGESYYQSLVVSNTGQYTGAFSQINPSGKQIYFNGQKIYENENYTNSGNLFIPSGFITLCTGTYFTMPDFDGGVYYTGFPTSDYLYDYNQEAFYPKSVVFYINGVREGYQLLLEHSSKRDLITGFEVELTGLSSLFEGSVSE